MRRRSLVFLFSVIVLLLSSCSNLANDLQKRKNQNLFNIKIQECPNGTVTAPKASGIKAGDEVILTVTATTGYELKTLSVINTLNKDVAVAAVEQGTSYKFTMPSSDVTVGAVFDKTGPVDITEPEEITDPVDITDPDDILDSNGSTFYTIYHYKQSLEDSELYDLSATQSKRGDAGNKTNAVPKSFPGFTAQTFTQETISADGSTIVRIYYDRNIITYTFYPNGGNWDGSTAPLKISGQYKAPVNKPDPQKPGYSLEWNTTVPGFFGLENATYTANWIANTNTPYIVRIYLQNVEGGNNYTLDEEISRTGKTDTNTNYGASSKTGFNLQTYNQININGDGSTVLEVYYKRIAYIVCFETNGGNAIEEQYILYQANPTQIPIRDGYVFYHWCTDISCDNVYDSTKGITKNQTLYAAWIDNSITYRIHETVERLSPGTDGTFGTTGEYVLFGDYPQSLLSDNSITVDETKTMKMGGTIVYGGSDGNVYYKYENKDNGIITYYKIEPIKWRVISRNENGIAVLLTEKIIEISPYGADKYDGIYKFSLIHHFLNDYFLLTAFTVSAQSLIELVTIESDTHYPDENEQYVNYSNDKIYLLSESDVFYSGTFPTTDSRKRTLTGFTSEKGCAPQDMTRLWWLRSSSYRDDDNGCIANFVESDGGGALFIVEYERGGVVPALSIYLPPAN